MDNFQNNNMNNESNENSQSAFSYNYTAQSPIDTTASEVEKKPKKTGKVFTKVIAFAVCAAVISAGSIQAYKYIDDNFSFNNFFSRNASVESENNNESSNSVQGNDNNSDQKSLMELASREGSLTVPEAVDKVMPAVVGISSEFPVSSNQYSGWFFSQGQQTETQVATATGTGIVMTSEGYIITNAHVIYDETNNYGKATNVSVLMSDETEYEASIIGYDTDTDIAVLKIDATGLTAAEFGNSDDLQVGELVLAVGNPLGFELFGSVTSGIVSALNREITINDKNMNLIQTDAAINSGNSGGPLINSFGQVIGINSAKMTSTYSSASVEGLGFAIPITQAKEIIDDLISFGYVKGRPQIGITCINVDESTASLYNMPVGAYVRSVTPNGAADLAGIQEGDIIIGADGQAISSTEELNDIKNNFNAGDTLKLTISRNGEDIDVNITLQEVTQGDNIFGNQEAVEN